MLHQEIQAQTQVLVGQEHSEQQNSVELMESPSISRGESHLDPDLLRTSATGLVMKSEDFSR